MPKTKGKVPPPKSRTSGQSAQPGDKNSLPVETEKTADMVRDTVEPGEAMTGNQGVRISDDQNSLKAGTRGPTLMEDFHLREKITHFDHERIPERVVHARGTPAHGIFQVYEDLSDLTQAGLLADPVARDAGLCAFFDCRGLPRIERLRARCPRLRSQVLH